jgi:MFS family permease
MSAQRPHLPLSRILEMNLGFLGLQFSFGLQQGNMGPIYSYLGADESQLPMLQLAGPITGLLVQPIIGALSDRTDSKWGRRTPFFLIGAVLCTFGLFFMPLSSSILMAMSLLWMLATTSQWSLIALTFPTGLTPINARPVSCHKVRLPGLRRCWHFLRPRCWLVWG